ncbi:MAG: hypothetical protein Q4D03_05610 [Bacteroidales bacterium]|nr:hypothetical protein [Bacteroidales bacterium]
MKKNLLFGLLLALSLTGLQAQGLFDFGIRATYQSVDPYDLYSDVQTSVQTRNAELIKQSNLGFLFRFNLGDRFFIQPEIGVSPNAIWDSLDSDDMIFAQLAEAYENAQSATVSIPVLVGARLFSIGKLLSVRLFVGPEFYTEFSSFTDINWKTYSVLGGVSADILGFIYADARVSYLPSANLSTTLNHLDQPSFYAFTVGIKF